jgi:hypothetical protein
MKHFHGWIFVIATAVTTTGWGGSLALNHGPCRLSGWKA